MTPADREKLVADFEHAIMALGTGETLHDLSPKIVTLKLARAALLAAMEPVGEVYEVQDEPNLPGPMVLLPHGPYLKGQRVRVTRVEGEA